MPFLTSIPSKSLKCVISVRFISSFTRSGFINSPLLCLFYMLSCVPPRSCPSLRTCSLFSTHPLTGEGMQPTNINICGAITNNFRLPNFCRCTSEPLGGTLACTVGIAGVSIGASAWVRPCASPANFGWRAWASVFGMSRVRPLIYHFSLFHTL